MSQKDGYYYYVFPKSQPICFQAQLRMGFPSGYLDMTMTVLQTSFQQVRLMIVFIHRQKYLH